MRNAIPVAAAGLLALAASAGDRPDRAADGPRFATYRLEERQSSSGPSGPRVLARAARVRVLGSDARLDVEGEALPRSRARTVFASPRGWVFLDPETAVAAAGDGPAFDALFRGAPADAGSTTSEIAVDEARVEPEGAGPAFQGRGTRRWRVSMTWSVSVSLPGRRATVKNELGGVLLEADGLDAARSPFDSLTRLLAVRGDAEARLGDALAAVRGLVVSASFETRATRSLSANLLVSPGRSPEGDGDRAATARAERRLSDLEVREARPADGADLRAPEGVRYVSLERLSAGSEPIR